MEHNTDKEKWINEVLDSTRGIRRAQPGNDLFDRVTTRLSRSGTAVRLPLVRWAAAAIFLVVLNVGSVIYDTHQGSHSAPLTGESAIATEMQSVTTYNY
jgi:hypothetical protein